MSQQDDEDIAHMGASPARFRDPTLALEAKKALVWALMFGIAALCVVMARPLLIIFAGAVFAAMLDGGARMLERVIKISRGWRLAIVITLGIAFLAWLATYTGTTLTTEAAELPTIIQGQLRQLATWGQEHGLGVDPNNLQPMFEHLASGVGGVASAVSGFFGGLATMLMIAILGIYFAMEPRLYERGVAWMMPEDRRHDFYITASKMGSQLRHLLAGRLFGMAVEGGFTWFMLWIYGVPMALLIGMLTGLLAFIPNIGALIAGVLMVLVGFSGGVDMGIYTIVVYFFVQTIDGYVLVPLIAKKTVDLAPALVLAAQLIMGVLFGILGLALADPLVAMAKVALERRSQQVDADHRFEADLVLE